MPCCLARAAQYLCPGVVLAVVDPGVGTDRRAVAVEVGRRPVGPRRPRQRAARAGGVDGRRRRPGRVAHQRRATTCRRRARPSPGATSSPRPPPTSCNGVDLLRARRPDRPDHAAPRRAAGHRRGRRRPRRRGAVGRPLRQRPAQRRSRRASRAGDAGSGACGDGGSRTARAGGRLRRARPATTSAWSSTPTAWCRSSMPRTSAAGLLGLAAGDQVRLAPPGRRRPRRPASTPRSTWRRR